MLCSYQYLSLVVIMNLKKVEIFTDGACSGNPGPGGWGVVLKYNGISKTLSGGEKNTTNNRMELTAVIKALEDLKERCEVVLTTDSKYVSDALTKGWAKGWQQKGWTRGKNQPAQNPDLWQRCLELYEYHQVSICWVKGHNGHPENELCDKMAVSETEKYKD